MLERNRASVWGEHAAQWVCERCGIENNSRDRNGNLAHVYRREVRDGVPMLDLCLLCRATLTRSGT